MNYQFLTGHGEFNAKLASFGLVGSARCRCLEGEETVEHMLFRCPLLDRQRERLRTVICSEGEKWPCDVGRFVGNRSKYQALRIFAKEAIGRKREYTYQNGLRRMGIKKGLSILRVVTGGNR